MENFLADDETLNYPLRKCIMVGVFVLYISSLMIYGLFLRDPAAKNTSMGVIIDLVQYLLLFLGALLEKQVLVLIWIIIQVFYYVTFVIACFFYVFGFLITLGSVNIGVLIFNAVVLAARVFLFWLGLSYYYQLNNGLGIESIECATGKREERAIAL